MTDERHPDSQRGIVAREGDIDLPPGAFTILDLWARGDVRIGEGARVAGGARGENVDVGREATVDGGVQAEASLVIGRGAVVTGPVHVGPDEGEASPRDESTTTARAPG